MSEKTTDPAYFPFDDKKPILDYPVPVDALSGVLP